MIKENYIGECMWKPHCPMNILPNCCTGGSFCTMREICEEKLKKGILFCSLKFRDNPQCKYFDLRKDTISKMNCVRDNKCIFE